MAHRVDIGPSLTAAATIIDARVAYILVLRGRGVRLWLVVARRGGSEPRKVLRWRGDEVRLDRASFLIGCG